MKIFDCITYLNENLVLDLRLNILEEYVDYFVIVEGSKTHSGKNKKIFFDINKFKKFKSKIRYFCIKNMPKSKNPWELENFQRNQIMRGLNDAQPNDLILISDADEIPDLRKIKSLNNIKNKIYTFSQKCFYYKLNLLNKKNTPWHGTKLVSFNYLKKKSPQYFRSYKIKKYPFWRIDKPSNINIIKNGGWHFSFLNNKKGIKFKLQSFAHQELNNKKFTDLSKINYKIKNQEDLFDNKVKLKKVLINNFYPTYIKKNKIKFKNWIA
jgi:beta-1,4-mannosyl-glycoprotein beta-1,4-N-acetylglucosaminyltransferase